jgi:hypothetical protein
MSKQRATSSGQHPARALRQVDRLKPDHVVVEAGREKRKQDAG